MKYIFGLAMVGVIVIIIINYANSPGVVWSSGCTLFAAIPVLFGLGIVGYRYYLDKQAAKSQKLREAKWETQQNAIKQAQQETQDILNKYK